MGDFYRYIIAVLWRVAIIFLPLSEAAFASLGKQSPFLTNAYIREMAANYSDFLLLLACLLLLVGGTTIGYFFPTPQYGAKPLPKPIKLLISVCCGCLAFIYYIHTEKDISGAVILWVAAVSFVSPAIIHLLHAGAIKFTGIKIFVTPTDLDNIKKSFKDDQNRS